MPGTPKRIFGPLALTTTLTTNVYNNASALIYDLIRHIHFVNKTAGSVTISLWLGATGANAAGTELLNGHVLAAHAEFDYYCALKLTSSDFIVGGSDTATAVTIIGEGEQYVV
jgi:hypothetical protein